MLHTFEEGTTIRRAISDAKEMIQPGLMLIGDIYFIKIGTCYMKIGKKLPVALSYLVAFFYILAIDYPLPLKFVYLYLETLFPLPLSINSIIARRFISELSVA